MTPKMWIFSLFGLLAAAMLYVPGSIILRYENILARGEQFKFRTRPVDPYDAFRGRYVALSFEDATTVTLRGEHYERGETVYVTLEKKPDGYARFAEASHTRPASGAYITTTMKWTDQYEKKGSVGYVEVPFDRYYMEESVAPKAETTYRQHSSRKERDAYALVRVLGGGAVIENVYVGDKTLRESALSEEKN
jgi:uncharacterized membrane-anchored protein